jgi:two-component system cell cycle sensor histidine kinase/response regulator CckA
MDDASTPEGLAAEVTVLRKRLAELSSQLAATGDCDGLLADNEEKYRSLFETSTQGILIYEYGGTIQMVNPAMTTLLGARSPEEIVGRTYLEFVHPDDREGSAARIETAFRNAFAKTGEINRNHVTLPVREHRLVDVAGNIVNVESTAVAFQFQGKTYLQGIYSDISERRRAQESLKQSEERYRSIIENIEDGYFEVDTAGRLTFFNEPLRRIFDYPREELLGVSNKAYASPESLKRIFQAFNAMYKTGTPVKVIDYEILRRDGEIRHLEVSASLIRDNAGKITGFRGIARDMTEHHKEEKEREKLKGQLQQAQKMEAIGTLAGGIAHDFNNLLMAILGNVSLMRLDMDHLHPHHERLLQIEKQVVSGADLTKRLLGFARGGRYEVRPVNINDVIDKTAAMFGRTKKEITIHTKFAKDIATVEVDQGQIEQVLMNLYVNAWQAMPAGGELYLETRNVDMAEGDVQHFKVKPGRYVRISVADTGVGMDIKTKERIFDPFFTTKEMGKGTGLGLAMVYGIVTGHEGIINVYSEPGQGATFSIYLPASRKEIVGEKIVTAAPVKGSETVLVVDDERSVLDVSKDMLETLGYRVYVAGGGQEAVAVYAERKDKIDLVILDLIMPGLSGEETFDRLRGIDPEVRVLLSSGYTINTQARQIMDRGCLGFMQKPFHIQDLSRKLREVLDR